MTLVVKKFGGSSLASLKHFKQVAEKICASRKKDEDVVVVVSAMAGETAQLIELAGEIAAQVAPREYDALLATGELKSVALLSMLLSKLGCPAVSLNAGQVRIITTNQHKRAQIKLIETQHLQRHLRAGIVPVVAGFQGVNEFGELTTLDRGGSDATAIAIAYALKADECQIYTDVPGVFTSDPNTCDGALRIPRLSYEKMLQMADTGAKVMQRYAVEIAKAQRVPLRVQSTFSQDEGTLLVDQAHCQFVPQTVQAITSRKDLVLLSFTTQPPARELSQVVGLLSRENIKIQSVNSQYFSHGLTLSLVLAAMDLSAAERVIKDWLHYSPQVKYTAEKERAEITLVGEALDETHFLALQSILEAESVIPDLIVTIPQKISLIFNQKVLQSLQTKLHRHFIEKTG